MFEGRQKAPKEREVTYVVDRRDKSGRQVSQELSRNGIEGAGREIEKD